MKKRLTLILLLLTNSLAFAQSTNIKLFEGIPLYCSKEEFIEFIKESSNLKIEKLYPVEFIDNKENLRSFKYMTFSEVFQGNTLDTSKYLSLVSPNFNQQNELDQLVICLSRKTTCTYLSENGIYDITELNGVHSVSQSVALSYIESIVDKLSQKYGAHKLEKTKIGLPYMNPDGLDWLYEICKVYTWETENYNVSLVQGLIDKHVLFKKNSYWMQLGGSVPEEKANLCMLYSYIIYSPKSTKHHNRF